MSPKKLTDEEFIERVKNMDWSSSKLKPLEPDKIYLVVEKLDKIIELLTPKPITVNSPVSVRSSNESIDLTEALLKLTKKMEYKKDTRRVVVERNAEGKRVRDGLLNKDGSVEWIREYH